MDLEYRVDVNTEGENGFEAGTSEEAGCSRLKKRYPEEAETRSRDRGQPDFPGPAPERSDCPRFHEVIPCFC